MKKVINHLLFATLFIVLITSCKKDNTPTIVTPKEVTGKWRWIATYIDMPLGPNNPLTPANTGTTESMEYTAIKEWKKGYNNIIIDSGAYSLEHNTYTNPSDFTYKYDQISYNRNGGYLGEDYYEIHGDTLVFCPCYRGYYTSLNVRYIGGSKWFIKQ